MSNAFVQNVKVKKKRKKILVYVINKNMQQNSTKMKTIPNISKLISYSVVLF